MSESNGANGSNGAARTDEKVRVAIVGVGNCANSFIQGVHYYKDADPAEEVPGLMHVDLGGYHVQRRRVRRRLRHRLREGRQGPLRGDLVGAERHDQVRRRAGDRGQGRARHDPRRPRQVPQRENHQSPRGNRRRRRHPQGDEGGRAGLLPAGRLRGGDQVVRRAGAQGRRRLRQLPARLHRPRGLLGQALPGGRAADHRRRHQVPGRGDDRPPPARPALPRPRRARRAHLAAQRRRQHGLLQHARARAARLEEDLEDQRGHLDHGPRAARRPGPRRPLRLRRLADRPQVGAHPRRGQSLRRRAAQRRAQARGLGLAELRRRRDRRRADPQAGAQQRRRRPARRPVQLPDEVPAQPAARRRGARADRGVHRQARARQEPGARARRRPEAKTEA